MTPQPVSEPRCAVCGTTVTADTRKCPNCGLARPAARGRGTLARGGYMVIGSVLVLAWVVALAVVAAAR